MSGFNHKQLRVPLGMLTDPKIPLTQRLLTYYAFGPDVNFVSAPKLAVVLGLDVSSAEKSKNAAASIRVAKGRLVDDGVLARVKDVRGGVRVVLDNPSQASLDMLSSLDNNVYSNPTSEEKEADHIVSDKLSKVALKGWDHIPYLDRFADFNKLTPFAFVADKKDRIFFWEGFARGVKKVISKSKTKQPVPIVSWAVYLWSANEIRTKKGYPKNIESKGGYFLTKVMASFPVALLWDREFMKKIYTYFIQNTGSMTVRCYLQDNDNTRVPSYPMPEELKDIPAPQPQPAQRPSSAAPASSDVPRDSVVVDEDDDLPDTYSPRPPQTSAIAASDKLMEREPESPRKTDESGGVAGMTPVEVSTDTTSQETERWLKHCASEVEFRENLIQELVDSGKEPCEHLSPQDALELYKEEFSDKPFLTLLTDRQRIDLFPKELIHETVVTVEKAKSGKRSTRKQKAQKK